MSGRNNSYNRHFPSRVQEALLLFLSVDKHDRLLSIPRAVSSLYYQEARRMSGYAWKDMSWKEKAVRTAVTHPVAWGWSKCYFGRTTHESFFSFLGARHRITWQEKKMTRIIDWQSNRQLGVFCQSPVPFLLPNQKEKSPKPLGSKSFVSHSRNSNHLRSYTNIFPFSLWLTQLYLWDILSCSVSKHRLSKLLGPACGVQPLLYNNTPHNKKVSRVHGSIAARGVPAGQSFHKLFEISNR